MIEDTFIDLGEGAGFAAYECNCTIWAVCVNGDWQRDADGHHTVCSTHVDHAMQAAYGFDNWSRP